MSEPFVTAEQQENAATLGMWVFLATEVLFFGGLFLAYAFYRSSYPEIFGRAGKELNIVIGTINTAILLTSSLCVALSVHGIQNGNRKSASRYLASTVVLGFVFLCFKAYEYHDDFKKHLVPTDAIFSHGPDAPVMRLFYLIYYIMTGLHALHVTIGIVVLSVIWHRTRRGDYSREYSTPVEVSALYWHFVDLVWIFLYPLLYLMDRSS